VMAQFQAGRRRTGDRLLRMDDDWSGLAHGHLRSTRRGDEAGRGSAMRRYLADSPNPST
jgi:hypothetical protein